MTGMRLACRRKWIHGEKESLLGLQNQTSASIEFSGAKKSTQLGVFMRSYSSSSTNITEVPDFNTMYELYDPSTVMFFFRNKHIMIDLGTGNNNKINWAMKDKQEFIDIVETVYRGARKGRGLVIAPKDYSTKYRY
ncbi:thioredoxin-like protein YLS8 isoform X2 [Carya illinoinensis]|uniref:thioredoxin-like protein YLS8 isoform X2 n=1 Tax=Carya illinoinensis TaxID=32201 RepID=UPI001C72802B|nr:thioredoxin-like protein YLS8 isoform X2 [Carya illinoinensis]